MIRVALAAFVLLGLAACDGGPLLRDDYFGRAWLEPSRRAEPVRRDGNGNPVLPAPKPEQEE